MKNIAPWTKEQINKLTELAGTMSSPQIAALVGKSRDAVKNKIERMGLPRYVVPKPTIDIVPEPCIPVVAEPPKAVATVPTKEVTKPLRQKPPSRDWPPLEYCSECGSPVSNWTEHTERMGHKRQA